MKLSARLLTSFQKCSRLPLLEGKGGRWRPKSLFDASWRKGLLALSQGSPLEKVTLQAREAFLSQARSPGLELGSGDPFGVAQDYCGALETSLQFLSEEGLLSQALLPPFHEGELEWTPSSFQDETGTLHRWASGEHAGEQELWREVHGWGVFGDMALSGLPLVLHFLELGSFRGGRLHGPWTKCWKHPLLAGTFRFQNKGGKPLGGDWKPFFYSSQSSRSPAQWVALLRRDGLSPLREVSLPALPSGAREEFLREASQEGRRMKSLPSDFRARPKTRGACDFPFTCPFQFECYGLGGPPPTEPEPPRS